MVRDNSALTARPIVGENSDAGSQLSTNRSVGTTPYLSNPPSGVYSAAGSGYDFTTGDLIPGLVSISGSQPGLEGTL